MLKAGLLDRQIVIQQITTAPSTSGFPSPTVTTFATVFAQVIPFSATERFSSDAEHSAHVNTFRIRYLSGLNAKMQISYESLNYRILGIRELGRREGMDVLAEAIE